MRRPRHRIATERAGRKTPTASGDRSATEGNGTSVSSDCRGRNRFRPSLPSGASRRARAAHRTARWQRHAHRRTRTSRKHASVLTRSRIVSTVCRAAAMTTLSIFFPRRVTEAAITEAKGHNGLPLERRQRRNEAYAEHLASPDSPISRAETTRFHVAAQ